MTLSRASLDEIMNSPRPFLYPLCLLNNPVETFLYKPAKLISL